MVSGSPLLNRLVTVSHRVGGPRVWDFVRGGRIRILSYHGITSRKDYPGIENPFRYNIPVEEFEAQVAYLKEHCQVVSLADVRDGVGLSRRRTNVVITFDDGYANNYENAFAILEQEGLPATYALATSFVIDRQPLWNDVVEHLAAHSPGRRAEMTWDGRTVSFELAERRGRLDLYRWLMKTVIAADQTRREELLQTAAEVLQTSIDPETVFQHDDMRPLSREQVAEMAASPRCEIASHSIHHFVLTRLPAEKQRHELVESKRRLEELTGAPVTTFCVPSGVWDDALVKAARDAGYTRILCSDRGDVQIEDPVWRRCAVFGPQSEPDFADVVHGPFTDLVDWVRRRRAA